MQQYLDLVKLILEKGRTHEDRTGVGRRSVFAHQMRFNLAEGFPLLTTKFTAIRPIIHELLWFLSGSTDVKYLLDNNVHIWDEWCDPVYKTVNLSYAEILKNIENAVLWTNEQRLVQVFKEVDGELTKEIIPPEEVTSDMAAYGEILELADKLSKLHQVEIKTTKQVLAGGELGPIYSKVWRAWPDIIYTDMETERAKGTKDYRELIDRTVGEGYCYFDDGARKNIFFKRSIDQISILIENLKKNPFSSRHIVSGWNPALLPEEGKSHLENVRNGKQALPPCHTMFQFFVEELAHHEFFTHYGFFSSQVVGMSDYEKRWQKEKHNSSWTTYPVELDSEAGKEGVLAFVINEWTATDDKKLKSILAVMDENRVYPEAHQLKIHLNLIKYMHETAPDTFSQYRLSCQLYQRSADVFLGVPFNIASYALLTMMIAQCVDMVPGDFIHTLGDAHLYSNHFDQAKAMLKQESFPLPTMTLNPDVKNIDDFKYEDFTLDGYKHGGKLTAPVAV